MKKKINKKDNIINVTLSEGSYSQLNISNGGTINATQNNSGGQRIEVKNDVLGEIPSNIHTDNLTYKEIFDAPLFLEDSLGDGEKALLSTTYVHPKYSIKVLDREKRIDIFDMLLDFFNNRKNFTIHQDVNFPVVSKRIFAVMIMGKPGIGKSSLVSYLSKNLENKVNQRPVYILRLRNMRENQINAEPIEGILSYMRISERELENSILVLDGLDEICAIYNRMDFQAYLSKLLKNLQSIRGLQLVVTSRTGYFNINNDIERYCLVVHIDNWDNADMEKWSKQYLSVHPELHEIVNSNLRHLQDVKYSDKKAIFAVPILFYMANARKEYLLNHSSICSVYDAVLTEVAGERNYDDSTSSLTDELISPEFARQICREIAFTMFRKGRLALMGDVVSVDPYLSPEEVDLAISEATQICVGEHIRLNERNKKKIKDFYALTFYYNKYQENENAVEFAHKTIAEYFTAEKMLELMIKGSKSNEKQEFYTHLSECFSYMPLTSDIALYICEKIKLIRQDIDTKGLKNRFEDDFVDGIISGDLFKQPTKYKSEVHYLDKAMMMIKALLLIFEYLDCESKIKIDNENTQFNNIIATISRAVAVNPQHNSLLPICLNGFSMRYGEFVCGEFAEAHFSGSNLSNANFSDANLMDAQLSRSIIYDTDFSGANMAGADLTDITNCDGANFTQAELQGADLSRSTFLNVLFNSAELQEAILCDCTFGYGCIFNEANLYGANLDKADISQASIAGAIFGDDTNEEDEEVFVISDLTLTQSQFDYIMTFPNIELETPKIVKAN